MRKAAAVFFLLSFLFISTASAQNQPPVAEPQTVFTREPIEITLRGSDPEGRDLRFEIVEWPRYGKLSEPEPVIPPEETDPRTGEPWQPPITSAIVVYYPGELVPDSFTFAAIDVEEAIGTAIVAINPESEEPPPPPAETITAHDVEDEILANTQTTLTLTASAPEGTGLRYSLLSKPRYGMLGELEQSSETSATVSYTPEREFIGEDGFEFEVCGDVSGKFVCDAGVYRIRVVEPPQEEPRLISDVHVKTRMNQEAKISLESETRAPQEGPVVIERAVVAGQVYADGVEVPVLMNANEGTHMQIELGLERLHEFRGRITRADVVLHTYRSAAEGDATSFHRFGAEADGELTPSDYKADVERIRGAVMPMPSLEQMPVGAEGTFSFDILGELNAALDGGFRYLAVQGRGTKGGLDVRTTAPENVKLDMQPRIVAETLSDPEPLTYTIVSLPEVGTLYDSGGFAIREVPHRLRDEIVVYKPMKNFTGKVAWYFEATNGYAVDIAHVFVDIYLGRCEDDAAYCNNGR